MTLINPVTQLTTDIAAEWDNTNVSGVAVDLEVKSRDSFLKSGGNTSTGLLVVRSWTFQPRTEFGSQRGDKYILDCWLMCTTSEAALLNTIQELDRTFNDINDAPGATFEYSIEPANSKTSASLLKYECIITIEGYTGTVSA